MEQIHRVKISRRSTTNRVFDSITVVMGDLHLHADLVNDRQIRLAKGLADSHKAPFMVDEANAERVKSALAQQ